MCKETICVHIQISLVTRRCLRRVFRFRVVIVGYPTTKKSIKQLNKPVIYEGSTGTIVIYQDDAEKIRAQALLYEETLWLTQKMLTELFDTSKQNISKHLRRIFEDGELIENSVVNYLLTTASDGKRYQTKLYNLDAVIAVGYRVNSKRVTSFRICDTQILREYIVKGFAMDDEWLKNPEWFLGKTRTLLAPECF